MDRDSYRVVAMKNLRSNGRTDVMCIARKM